MATTRRKDVQAGIVCVKAYGFTTEQTQPWRGGAAQNGTGTGFFVPPLQAQRQPHDEDESFILTCAHVVESASQVSIILPLQGRSELPARVVCIIPSCSYDLALLAVRLTAKQRAGTHTLRLGDSDALVATEDTVIAVGFSMGFEGMGWSEGKYSTLQAGRLQHTASISGGNSGGPLVNSKYEVVGVNSSGMFGSTANNINFAVPIELYKRVQARMFSAGAPGILRLPMFGFCYESTSSVQALLDVSSTGILAGGAAEEDEGGVRVCAVLSTGPAARAGLIIGDILLAFNGDRIDRNGEVSVPWHIQRVELDQILRRTTDSSAAYALEIKRANGAMHTLRVSPDAAMHVNGMFTRLPPFDPLRYVGFAGMVFQDLCANFFQDELLGAQLAPLKTPEERVKPRVIITCIVRGADPVLGRNLKTGLTVSHINRRRVSNLTEVRIALLIPVADKRGAPVLEVVTTNNRAYVTPILDVVLAETQQNRPYALEENVLHSLRKIKNLGLSAAKLS